MVRRQIQKMMAVRKKPWPAMSRVLVGQLCRSSRRATSSRHLQQRFGEGRREHDRSVVAPSATTSDRGIADRNRRTAGEVSPLQLALGKECNRAAIRGPEWKRVFLCSRDRLRFELIQRTKEQLILTLGTGAEQNVLAVGRNHRRTPVVARSEEHT